MNHWYLLELPSTESKDFICEPRKALQLLWIGGRTERDKEVNYEGRNYTAFLT